MRATDTKRNCTCSRCMYICPAKHEPNRRKTSVSDHVGHKPDRSCYGGKPDVIKAFTSDGRILALTEYFLGKSENGAMRRSDFQLSSLSVCQLKLIFAYYRLQNNDLFSDVTADLTGARSKKSSEGEQLLKPEFLLSLKNRLECVFDKWQTDNTPSLVSYLKGESLRSANTTCLSPFLLWFDIPTPDAISQMPIDGPPSLPILRTMLPDMRAGPLLRLYKILHHNT